MVISSKKVCPRDGPVGVGIHQLTKNAKPMPVKPEEYRKAQRHLSKRDAILKKLIAGIGPCTLRYEPDRFASLVRAIIAQQISTKAARSIQAKVEAAVDGKGLTARAILKTGT